MRPHKTLTTPTLAYSSVHEAIHPMQIENVLNGLRWKQEKHAVSALRLIQALLARIVYLENELGRIEDDAAMDKH